MNADPITGRTAGFNGPSLDLLGQLSAGKVYQVTAAVRLVAGEVPTQLIITVQRTPTGGSTAFRNAGDPARTASDESARPTAR